MNKNVKTINIVVAVAILVLASLPGVFGVTILNNMDESNIGFHAVNIDETTIEITVNPGEFEFDTEDTEEGLFATVALSNFVYSLVEGEAKLPAIRKMIEIPQESNPEITVTSTSWDYTSLNELSLPGQIIPAQFSVEKIPGPTGDFVLDDDYYSSNAFLPEVTAKIVETGQMRSRRFALVEISPIQYKPLTGELKLMTSCELTINLPDSDMTQTYEKIERYSTPSYEKIFENAFNNYGFYEQGLGGRNTEGFLAIVYDSFYDELQPLTNLKESKGYDVTVTKTSDIPGGPSKENIYNYIEDAYDNWNIPPAYVLLVGDTPQIPTFSGTTGPSAVDLYYVTVDGSDWIPDIHIGRFPGSTETHIETMVEKTVYYETGGFPSIEWIKKAAFLASTDNYYISEGTHNYVIDNYLDPNGYTCDKLYTSTYGATTQQVHDAINDGRSLVIFSGHGSPSGWGDGPPFYISDVQALMNEEMYPFVCSHSCSTNTFDDSECFGETWLCEADKGGIAFWGASASTYWDEDDILEKGMFQAWWEDGLEWIGGMTDMGLIYLYENYSGGGSTKYYFEAYNVNGDPSVRIWSDNPTQPPETPSEPAGPDEWTINLEATFTASTTDPEGDSIYYMFDWGDGTTSEWLGPYPSGGTVETSYAWTELGDYEVKVVARDTYNAQSDWSAPHTISIIENSPPDDPIISGPSTIRVAKQYTYTVIADDPEDHDVYYYIYWGDGDYVNWEGPYNSGEATTFQHSWSELGDYTIQVKAMDSIGDKSGITHFDITVTNSRATQYNLILRLLENLMKSFPILERLLNL
ncbi:MAG: PKD domain-containing protein [Thermoplasmatales archaeon]|nr:PKD domain-containing protein [Thermoplasmatales archaeon]